MLCHASAYRSASWGNTQAKTPLAEDGHLKTDNYSPEDRLLCFVGWVERFEKPDIHNTKPSQRYTASYVIKAIAKPNFRPRDARNRQRGVLGFTRYLYEGRHLGIGEIILEAMPLDLVRSTQPTEELRVGNRNSLLPNGESVIFQENQYLKLTPMVQFGTTPISVYR